MKRSITRWTTTLATAALLGLPIAAAASTQQQQPSAPPPQQQQPAPQPAQPPAQPQPTEPQQPTPTPQPTPAPQPTQPPAQPQPTEPQPTQPPTEPQPTQQPTASATQPSAQSESPEEHLQQARAAFNDIKMTSIPARNRAEFAELRRHLAALDNPSAPAASSRSTSRGSRSTAASASNWGTEVAAIDRLITHLAGSDTTTGTAGAATPGATGTAGTSRSAAVAVDEATRAKLMEIRTHITAYAAAKAGASSPRSDAEPTAATQPTTSTAPAGNATAGETPRTGNYPAPPNAAAQPPQSTTPSAQGTAGNTPAAQPPTTDAQAAAAGAAKVDTEAAHRSLLAARDALNQLTQLPAAAQLTGEVRTQVQQLITSFNELVTNTSDWRPSYAKVAASLTTLLGPDNSDAAAAAATPTTAPGAVGTAGAAAVQLDPAIRAKLVEMRNNLNEFQKASGGVNK